MNITISINKEDFKRKLGIKNGIDGKNGIGKDGVHGKTPSNEELLNLIAPLIPHVKDGETPTEEYLKELIKPLIPEAPKYAGGGLTQGSLQYHLIDNIAPSGLINGSNKVFALPDIPETGTLKVHADGARQEVTKDYTLSGRTITFVFAPSSSVICDYRV